MDTHNNNNLLVLWILFYIFFLEDGQIKFNICFSVEKMFFFFVPFVLSFADDFYAFDRAFFSLLFFLSFSREESRHMNETKERE